MFADLSRLVGEASTWAYLVVALFAALDVFLPVVPSETAVITAGVVASAGDLALPAVIVGAAAGAFIGDNSAYYLASRIGPRAAKRISAGRRGRRSLDWARRQMRRRGAELILVGRFIPGGRSAVCLTAGMTGYSWPRFAGLDLLAAAAWATYASLLGFLGGRVFERSPLSGLLVALAIAVIITLAIEGIRRVKARRRGRSSDGCPSTPSEGRSALSPEAQRTKTHTDT
ncbi:MAG TPA: DedA family protein [Mycobacteriales bacterium]|nr:DedA family protein [Mycobacteriales bacterium]